MKAHDVHAKYFLSFSEQREYKPRWIGSGSSLTASKRLKVNPGSFLYTGCSNHLDLALSQRQKSLYNWIKRSLELFEKIWFVMTTWHCLCQLRPTIYFLTILCSFLTCLWYVLRTCCDWNRNHSKVSFAKINVFCPCKVKIYPLCALVRVLQS